MRLVLDASAAVRIVMRGEDAMAMLDLIEAATLVTAPTLYATEVANALWKYVQAGHIELELAIERYEEAIGLIDTFMADAALTIEAMAQAVHFSHPVYDLLYAILAKRQGCFVLTRDRRLAVLLERMEIARPESKNTP